MNWTMRIFDIRVAHLNARSYGGLSTETILERAEKEKKPKYNTRVINAEHGTFTPLAFGTNGSRMCHVSQTSCCQASRLKNQMKYSEVMQWLRPDCRLVS